MKDYLGYENARNREHAALYTALIHRAYGDGPVMVGHHLVYETCSPVPASGTCEPDPATEREIPSADTMMFCHDLMSRAFGARALAIMQHLASVPVEQRDGVLSAYMAAGAAADDVRAYQLNHGTAVARPATVVPEVEAITNAHFPSPANEAGIVA